MKDKVKFWRPQAEKWAKQTGTPAALILAVIEMESGGQPFVTRYEPEYQKNYVDGNKKNMAIVAECGLTHEQAATPYGLMQLMFPLAYGYGARSVKVLLDPDQNIRFGAAHLSMLIKKHGGALDGASIRKAAGAYNGSGASGSYAKGVYTLFLQYDNWLKD